MSPRYRYPAQLLSELGFVDRNRIVPVFQHGGYFFAVFIKRVTSAAENHTEKLGFILCVRQKTNTLAEQIAELLPLSIWEHGVRSEHYGAFKARYHRSVVYPHGKLWTAEQIERPAKQRAVQLPQTAAELSRE